QSQIVFYGSPFVGKLPQLERNDNAFQDHGRAKARSQAEKEHRAAAIASQRLHGSIINDPHGTPEGGFEIETDPALCKVTRLGDRPIEANPPGVTDRHEVIFPVFRQLFYVGNHGPGSQVWT